VPTYQYRCTECGEDLEVVQKFSDEPLTVCPACQGALRKVFSPVGIVFKGSGFYRTDSRNGSGAGSGPGSGDGAKKDKEPAGGKSAESSSADSGKSSANGSSSGSDSSSSSGSSSSGSSSSGKSGKSSSSPAPAASKAG
jgi:putative FmdB family regulatory protein